jgi:branched-chain amino acid transport system ATP-binding protein
MSDLVVQNVSKAFGGFRVTRNVSLTVESGERHLILGPNGAGKTTLFNQITGEFLPDSGRIVLHGQDITRFPPQQRTHLGISRTYQIITLFAKDTLLHNVTLAALGLTWRRWNPFVSLAGQQDLREKAMHALSDVGLADMADRPLAGTSYGERRRVEIAMALVQGPKVLLLDEPFAGLSGDERQSIKTLLAGLPRRLTMVMIEHDMTIALDWAERITLMNFGEVVVQGTKAEVVANPRTHEVYLGS